MRRPMWIATATSLAVAALPAAALADDPSPLTVADSAARAQLVAQHLHARPLVLKQGTQVSVAKAALEARSVATQYRRVVVGADMYIEDDETWGENERARFSGTREAIVGPSHPLDVLEMIRGVGGEVRVELRSKAIALSDGSARVDVHVDLYEGTSENTGDLDGSGDVTVYVPKDGYASKTFRVWNSDEGGDFTEITLNLANFAA